MVEPVPSFQCSEYFNHYLGTPGNFELKLLKDTNLLSTLIPEYEVKNEELSVKSEASLISLAKYTWFYSDRSFSVCVSKQPDDL